MSINWLPTLAVKIQKMLSKPAFAESVIVVEDGDAVTATEDGIRSTAPATTAGAATDLAIASETTTACSPIITRATLLRHATHHTGVAINQKTQTRMPQLLTKHRPSTLTS